MKKENLRIIGHFLAGFVILLHGWTAYTKGHPTSWIFMLLGILFLSIALFHKRIHRRFPRVDGIFFLIESFAFAATAYDYVHEHKTYLPWVMMVITLLYLVLAFLALSGKKKFNPGHH
jgi:hypothetical protein